MRAGMRAEKGTMAVSFRQNPRGTALSLLRERAFSTIRKQSGTAMCKQGGNTEQFVPRDQRGQFFGRAVHGNAKSKGYKGLAAC